MARRSQPYPARTECLADEAAQRERERLHELLDSLPVMIALITRDHRIAFANRAFKNTFGEELGPTCHRVAFGSDKPCEFCRAFQVFETGVPQRWETPAKEGRIYEVFDLPFKDVDGTDLLLEMDIDVTDSRRQSEALEHAREELSRRATDAEELAGELIRYAPTGIYSISFDPPRFLSINEAMVELSGYPREELLAMNPFDLLEPDSAALFRSRVVLTLAGEEPEREVEYTLIRKDGGRLHVTLNAHFEKDRNGRPVGAFVIAHDVTERRRAEEAARHAEERQSFMLHFSDALRDLENPAEVKAFAARTIGQRLNLSAVGYMEVETGGNVAVAGGEYSDARTASLEGSYDLAEFGVIGDSLKEGIELFSDDITVDPRANASVREVAASVDMRAWAMLPLVKSGRLVAYLYAGSGPVRAWSDDDKMVLRQVAQRTWEAVERAQAQAALRESQERLTSVLENSTDAAYRRDLVRDTYDYMSPVIERISGFTTEEFVGLSTDDVLERIHPDDREGVLACIAEGANTGEFSCEYRFRRKDGEYVWFGDQARIVNGADGTPLYRSGTVRDSTRRVEAERELRATLQRVRALVEREEALKEVAQISAASLARGVLATRIAERVAGILGAARASVRLVSADGAVLKTLGSYGFEDGASVVDMRVDSETDTALVFRTGEMSTCQDLSHAPSAVTRDNAARLGLRSHAVLPILVEGRPIGVLSIGWSAPRSFAREDVSFMRAITAQFAVGLQNARLFDEQKSRRRRIEALHGVMEAAVSAPDVRTAGQSILRYLAGHYDFDTASMWLASDDALELVAHTGYPAGFETISPLPCDADYDACTVYRTGESMVVRHPTNPAVLDVYRRFGMDLGSYTVLPLMGREHPIGTIVFSWWKPQEFAGDDLEFYESVAAEISVVLENAARYDAEREAARLGAALAEIDRHVHSSLDFSDVARRALSEGAAALGADTSSMSSLSDQGWETRFDFGFAPTMQGKRFPQEEIPHGVLALERGEPVAIDDAVSDRRVNVEVTARYGIKSVIVAPLIVRGQSIGVLFYNFCSAPHTFNKSEIEFVTRLSSSLSLAFENARLYETEHDIAETLQETLVILPASVQGIAFSRAYQSATYQTGRVGGDFVDVFEVQGHIIGLGLGDVSGKGIDAAVTTSLIRTTLRVHALEGLSPEEIGRRTNRMMHRFTEAETFVTLWFGLLDTRNGQLRYISAGHPPGLVIATAGDIRELEWGDSVVGAVDEAHYTERAACLRMGDRLVLYSDGITESRSPDGRFLGHEGLMHMLARHRRVPTEALADALMDDVIGFSQGVLRDDAAILAVEPIRLRRRCPGDELRP